METAVIPSQDVNKRILTFRKPNGVYAAITPWNFPTLIPVELIAPGIAIGNAIVMKPSEWTPIAMANFMQIMADAGLPDGVVNVVYGGGDVGERLVTHPGVDGIGFVGSHATAERIVKAAGLKRSLIEASGNGPVIVCEDADLSRAAQGAVYGGFFCAGQVCCATERVLVHDRVHDAFLDEVLKTAAEWPLGDPFEETTLVGPMNNEPTASKMDRHLEDAVEKGANVVLGGRRADARPTRLYYEPTVVTDVGVDTLINREETFGPIVPLIRVGSDEEALSVANDSHLGLQAAVYTSSLRRAFGYVDNLRVGNVVVNDSTDYWEAHEPFGGAPGTQSGWGRIGGRYTMLDMSDLKTVVLDVGGLD
jgi:acyl-CoA reductase-like NAD-dependent aldehyde dehydrogenase